MASDVGGSRAGSPTLSDEDDDDRYYDDVDMALLNSMLNPPPPHDHTQSFGSLGVTLPSTASAATNAGNEDPYGYMAFVAVNAARAEIPGADTGSSTGSRRGRVGIDMTLPHTRPDYGNAWS